jgi:hypothetical protein
MATYFAHVNKNNVVDNVIVAGQEFIDSGAVGDPKNWIETFMDGSKRKNYAGIGHEYHADIDAFVPPVPFPSWKLDKKNGQYKAPKAKPNNTSGKIHKWDENAQGWVERDI